MTFFVSCRRRRCFFAADDGSFFQPFSQLSCCAGHGAEERARRQALDAIAVSRDCLSRRAREPDGMKRQQEQRRQGRGALSLDLVDREGERKKKLLEVNLSAGRRESEREREKRGAFFFPPLSLRNTLPLFRLRERATPSFFLRGLQGTRLETRRR